MSGSYNIYNDPIKIIYKVKNNHLQPQYHTYIFVGNVPGNIKSLLKKFQKSNLTDLLLEIKDNELKILTDYYGDNWFTYFFNKYHIFKTFDLDNKFLKDIKSKYGNKWLNDKTSKLQMSKGTYGFFVKKTMIHKILNEKKYLTIDDLNYNNPEFYLTSQYGGNKNTNDIINFDKVTEQIIQDVEDINTYDEPFVIPETTEDDEEQISLESDEIETYETTLYDDANNKQIQKSINKIFDDDILNSRINSMIKFDTSKDNNIYKEELENHSDKIYIFNQYIYHNDTIKTIKIKILFSIRNHPKYGEYNFLIPSRQYLWSEYFDDLTKKYDKIMIGLKWTQNYELLKISAEPYDNIKVYDENRNVIKQLNENLNKINSRIKKEDNENDILSDYRSFYQNNDIFLIDIYNELNINSHRTDQEIQNLTKTYVKIYFPKINPLEIVQIMEYLMNSNKITQSDIMNKSLNLEDKKIVEFMNEVSSELFLSDKIFEIVNSVRTGNYNKINKIIQPNNIIQSEIHIDLISNDINNFNRLDLFKIFDEFILDDKYIFIQCVQQSRDMVYKFNEKIINDLINNENMYDNIVKWFDNNKYGLTFKLLINSKIISVTLDVMGRLNYKLHWKESDNKYYSNISDSYIYIKTLIEDINNVGINSKFEIPKDADFKTTFITAIAKFNLNSEKSVNHNDLSNFSRLFYPFFALVIDPKKRISKVHQADEKSKYGTYLRYKRISKYENTTKIEERIRYYMQYYDATPNQIINEIAKQFNLTIIKSKKYYEIVELNYPYIKKQTSYKLKKIDSTIKYKTPGVDVSIQGKSIDKYKVKISGVRNYEQLIDINNICNVLLFLYTEIYMNKNSKFIDLKNILKKLSSVAERRFIVSDIVDYGNNIVETKLNTQMDKFRIGYKPKKGQSYYKRVCQNSGKTQRRRPQQYTDSDIDQIIKDGYKINKATGLYEKQITYNNKQITSRIVKLNAIDKDGNYTENNIYYTCDPKYNGQHSYIGFLTKSKNPYGEPMPCCFKKDQFDSENIEKKHLIKKSLTRTTQTITKSTSYNEQAYILQDTLKLPVNRLSFLPKILDFYFNTSTNRKATINQHLLVTTQYKQNKNYYFKMGVNDLSNSFIASVASCLNMDYQTIIDNCIASLNSKYKNQIFNYLNNGEISLEFKDIESYINHIKNGNINVIYLIHLLSTPSVLNDNGLNIIIFSKTQPIGDLEPKTFKYNYKISYLNEEELSNIDDNLRKNIILCEDGNNFFPVVSVEKQSDILNININKYFTNSDHIIEHIKDFYYKNGYNNLIKETLTAKHIYSILNKYKVKVLSQYIDIRNKTRYLIALIDNLNLLIPTHSSGSIYNLNIITNISKYIKSIDETLQLLNTLLHTDLTDYKPLKLQYDKIKDNKYRMRSILLSNNLFIPVKKIYLTKDELNSYHFDIENIPYYEKIDKYIAELHKQKSEKTYIISDKNIDERIEFINYNKYKKESYELFKYHISYYINNNDVVIKNAIIKIINTDNDDETKLEQLRTILYKIINNKSLNDFYSRMAQNSETHDINIKTKLGNKFHIYDDKINLMNYKQDNIRKICDTKNKDKCNYHCKWISNNCIFSMSKKMAIVFINLLSYELLENSLRAKEILQLDGYYISPIINENYYTERENQKILNKKNNPNENPFITYYKSENLMPKYESNLTYKSKIREKEYQQIKELQDNNKLRSLKDKYIQNIIPENNSILRAYVNGLNWIINSQQDVNIKNLGFYSLKQDKTLSYIKSLIIEWCLDYGNKDVIKNILEKYSYKVDSHSLINDYVIDITKNANNLDEKIYLLILNHINHIPIIVYDLSDEIKYIINNNIITDDSINDKLSSTQFYKDIKNNKINLSKIIHIKIESVNNVYVIYY